MQRGKIPGLSHGACAGTRLIHKQGEALARHNPALLYVRIGIVCDKTS
jgi:hypothetical protein